MLLKVRHLKKVYGKGLNKVTALNEMSFDVQEGEFVAIMGESGSGKSTLLNLIATFDRPTEGSISINQEDIAQLRNKSISRFRRDELGFVFQDFTVLDTMSNKDNILMPLVLSNINVDTMQKRLIQVTEQLGIQTLLDKYPYQVSGGQRQRVAIARALINKPQLLLADEPTGALDSKTSQEIMTMFKDINDRKQTILMVTHSIQDASFANRILFIKDGELYHELYRGDETQQAFQKRISDSLALLNGRGV